MLTNEQVDVIPVRLPSGTKAIIRLPRPFTVADATHLIAFLTTYIEDAAHGSPPELATTDSLEEA